MACSLNCCVIRISESLSIAKCLNDQQNKICTLGIIKDRFLATYDISGGGEGVACVKLLFNWILSAFNNQQNKIYKNCMFIQGVF